MNKADKTQENVQHKAVIHEIPVTTEMKGFM